MVTAYLIGVGVVCGITTLLCLLVILADATIGNYGKVRITINGEKIIEADGGHPLLSTLKEQQIFIPSACGGRGSCGLCKCRVTKGAGGILPTEMPWLSAEEQKDGVRLSCQLKVKGDFEIEIPPELFNIKEYRTVVESLRDLTHDIKEVRLRLIEPERISFKAGQFVQFEVPEYELTDQPVYRAYSVSSCPSDEQHVELEIRLVPNGICTTYVHKHLKVGDQVTINGAYGDFFLRDTNTEIIFIAGGSGMAPVKSILLDMAEKKNPRRARYFFGARCLRDLFLVDEMRELEKRLPNFQFIPALSQPQPEDEWNGESGLITNIVDRHVTSGENAEAYLCGSPGMIDACIAVLKKKGIPGERIFYDKFS
ncbi:MAG TPA: FAD-binding oxidoreductase [Candidatus Sumerlaeota bacterium]|nr:FAD-binding oxidoreductase [Candidatus Sumerlaeota bacterium]